MKQLSIIIPVYNVEPYIRTCIESVFRQNLDEDAYEIIIINDGSTDRSMEILSDIISSHNNIIVINQENQGVSVARNIGIEKAQGLYILMLDSDDLLADNNLGKLLNIALESNTDILVADFSIMSNNEIDSYLSDSNKCTIPKIKIKEYTGKDFLDEQYCRNVWRFLYNKEFILKTNIRFIPHITAQDVPFANECFLEAQKCIMVNIPLTIYRWGNPSQTTMYFNIKKAKDLCIVIRAIWELAKRNDLSTETRHKQENIVYAYFYRLISATTFGHIKSLPDQYEVIDYMKQLEPELCFKNGTKQIINTLMYKNMPHILIKTYNLVRRIKKLLKGH